LRGVELARKAGISASYVSLIEKGQKLPEEGVAARIARALDDDEELYRAWAREARSPTNPAAIGRLRRMTSNQALRRRLAQGEDLPGLTEDDEAISEASSGFVAASAAYDAAVLPDALASSMAADSAEIEGPELLQVPVLFEGADPGADSPHPSSVQDRLHLDQKLFAGSGERKLFAYVVSRESGERVRGLASPGDYVVFRRRAARISPKRIHVVRVKGRLVLSRVLFKGSALLLLPPESKGDFDVVDVGDEAGARRAIAGYSVLVIRR